MSTLPLAAHILLSSFVEPLSRKNDTIHLNRSNRGDAAIVPCKCGALGRAESSPSSSSVPAPLHPHSQSGAPGSPDVLGSGPSRHGTRRLQVREEVRVRLKGGTSGCRCPPSPGRLSPAHWRPNVLSPAALITSVFAASNALPNPRPFHALCDPSGWLSNTRCGPSATPTAMRMVPS